MVKKKYTRIWGLSALLLTAVFSQNYTLPANFVEAEGIIASHNHSTTAFTVGNAQTKVSAVDNTAPVVTIHAGESRVAQATFTVKATDTGGSGIQSIEYKLSGAEMTSWKPYLSEVTIFKDGETTIEARVSDNAGNTSISKKLITVQDSITENELVISPRPDGKWVNHDLDINISFFGDQLAAVDKAKKTYVITNSAKTPNTYPYLVPSSNVINISNEGLNYIHVRYEFDNGRAVMQMEGPYKIDKTSASGFSIWLEDSGGSTSGWSKETLDIRMSNPTTPQISQDTLQYKIDGFNTNWIAYSPATTIDLFGESRVMGRVVDEAGNISEVKVVSAQIDSTNPVISFIEAKKNATGKYDIKVNASDDVSGINTIKTNKGDVLEKTTKENLYALRNLDSLPTSISVTDKSLNKKTELISKLPTLSFLDSNYDIDSDIWRDKVRVRINGENNLSYRLGYRLVDCPNTSCTFDIESNKTLTVINELNNKSSSIDVPITNIDKTPVRLVLSGERRVEDPSKIDFKWNNSITGGNLQCDFNGAKKVVNGLNGIGVTLSNLENATYKCSLDGSVQGQNVTSNSLNIFPNYSNEIIRGEDTLTEVLVEKNIYMEKSVIGNTYYINTKKDNVDNKKIPLPNDLFN